MKKIYSPWVEWFIGLLLKKLGIKSKDKLDKLVEKTGIWGNLTIEKNEATKVGYEILYGLPNMSVRNLGSFRLFCEIHGFLPIPIGVKIQVASNRWLEFRLEDNNILSNAIKTLATLTDREADHRIGVNTNSILGKLEENNFIQPGFYNLPEFKEILREIHRLISFGYNVYAPLMGSGVAQEGRFSSDLMAEKVWLDMAFVLEDELRAAFEGVLKSTFLFPASAVEDFEQKTDMRGLVGFEDATSLEFPIQFSASRLNVNDKGNWLAKISEIKERIKKYPGHFLVINVSEMWKMLKGKKRMEVDLGFQYSSWRNNPFERIRRFGENNSNGGFPTFWYMIEKENPDLAQRMKVMYVFYHLLLVFLKEGKALSKGNFNKFKRQFARKINDVLGITMADYQVEISTKEENKGEFKLRIVNLIVNKDSSYIGAISWLEPVFY